MSMYGLLLQLDDQELRYPRTSSSKRRLERKKRKERQDMSGDKWKYKGYEDLLDVDGECDDPEIPPVKGCLLLSLQFPPSLFHMQLSSGWWF